MDVVIYGFGPIGRLIAECCLKRDINVVGAVDVDPEIVGKKLSDFGLDSDAYVSDSLDFEGDIAFLSTGSFLDSVYPQLIECVEAGFDVISTCETLSFPEFRYPELAEKLDVIAKENGKTILSTGINPGFLLDTLVVILSAPAVEVRAVRAVRCIDALKRRGSFQKKIGIGMALDEAKKMLEDGRMSGHVGYSESVALICEAMNFKPDEIFEGQEIVSDGGRVRGMKGWGVAVGDGVEKVRIEFHSIAEAAEYEEIHIAGDNEVTWRSTGTKGDLGTAAVVVNLAATVLNFRAGLIKMTDLIPFKPLLR